MATNGHLSNSPDLKQARKLKMADLDRLLKSGVISGKAAGQPSPTCPTCGRSINMDKPTSELPTPAGLPVTQSGGIRG
jgi:hypothetical protein